MNAETERTVPGTAEVESLDLTCHDCPPVCVLLFVTHPTDEHLRVSRFGRALKEVSQRRHRFQMGRLVVTIVSEEAASAPGMRPQLVHVRLAESKPRCSSGVDHVSVEGGALLVPPP